MKIKIFTNKTLGQYKKKYRHRKFELVQFSKAEVEQFDKENNTVGEKTLLKGRKWYLIKGTYYCIPKTFSKNWFRNLNTGVKLAGCALLAGGVATAITIPVHNIVVEQRFIDNPTIDPTIKSEAEVSVKEKTDKGIVYQVAPKNPTLKTIVKISKVTKGNVELVENTDYECSKPTSMSNETGTSVLLTIFASAMNKYKGEIVITPATQYVNLNVTTSVTHGSFTGDNVIQAVIGEKDITISADTGYKLPDVVTVTNADSTYDKNTGVIHLKNATSDVTISATCVEKKFSITPIITNGSTTGDTEIQEEIGTADVTIEPEDGYQLPEEEDITVENAEFTYDNTTGVIHLSNASDNVTISCACPVLNYSITKSLQHCSCTGCPEEIQAIIGEATGTIVADEGYKLPEEITVDGADLESYSKDTGVFKIKNATSNVTITSSGVAVKYDITGSITNGSIPSGKKIQKSVEELDIVITPAEGYKYPESVSVTGATSSYTATTGTVHLSNATGNVTITATCPELKYSISTSLEHCTCTGYPAEIQAKIGEATGTLKANDGYQLPDNITVTNATLVSYDKATGAFKINNATSNVTISCTGVILNYGISGTITNGSIPTDLQIQAKIGTKDIVITPADGYKYPESVSVTGAESSYTATTGTVHLSNATGNVTITATCPELKYSYSTTITNGSASPATGEIQAKKGQQEITLTPDTNYHLPDTITVTGAEYTYDKDNKKVTIKNATSDVTITCNCVMDTYAITTSVTNGSYTGDTKIGKVTGSTATITLSADANYHLPDSVTVTNATQDSYDKSTGKLQISSPTGEVTITCVCEKTVYSITTTVTNGSYSGSTSIDAGGTATVTLTANSGYKLPTSITVSGATYTYNSTTGVVSLSEPTGNVTISCTCAANSYSITTNVTNGSYTGSTSISTGGTATVTISATAGYKLPTSVTVTGATQSYNSSTGVITLSNPTGAVSITASCPEKEIQMTVDCKVSDITVNSYKSTIKPISDVQGVNLEIYDIINLTNNGSSEVRIDLTLTDQSKTTVASITDWPLDPAETETGYLHVTNHAKLKSSTSLKLTITKHI